MTKAEEYFEKGNQYFDKNEFSQAEIQYTHAIQDASCPKDLKMVILLNRGVVHFNLWDRNRGAGLTDLIQAQGDWREVLRYDDNPVRIAKAKELSNNLPEGWRP